MSPAPGRTDIRLAGSGGQGVVLAAVILAEAAMLGGQRVVQSQSYGPQSRGGASRADVVIGVGNGFPVSQDIDILVALNGDAVARYAGALRHGGLLLVDQSRIAAPVAGPWRVMPLPIERTALQATGGTLAANIVALGALCGATGIVAADVLEAAVRARVPDRTWPVNHRALRAGIQLARQAGSAGVAPAGVAAGPTREW